MRVEHSKLSLAGNRPENQDRVDVIAHDDAVLLVVVDGMGGHAHGARAAEVTVATLKPEPRAATGKRRKHLASRGEFA